MIDVKELHVGAHVVFDGMQCRVEYIGRIIISVITPNGDWIPVNVNDDRLQPIPITRDLLDELGFKGRFRKYFDYDLNDDEFQEIEFCRIRETEWWRVNVYDVGKNWGNLVCRYLHQAEFFVSMTIGKNLINDDTKAN